MTLLLLLHTPIAAGTVPNAGIITQGYGTGQRIILQGYTHAVTAVVLDGSQPQIGSLVIISGPILDATQGQSGALAVDYGRSLSATQAQTSEATAVQQGLTATQSQPGRVVRRVERVSGLVAMQGQDGGVDFVGQQYMEPPLYAILLRDGSTIAILTTNGQRTASLETVVLGL